MLFQGRTSAMDAFDKVAAEYDNTFLRPIDLAENKAVFDYYNTFAFDESSVIDIGCGTGFYLEHRHPLTYTGIDISNEMLLAATKKFPARRFTVLSMENMRCLKSNRFSLAVSLFGSFSYCLNPHAALQEIQAVLIPGGRFFVMTFGWRYHWRKSHIVDGVVPFVGYTKSVLARMFGYYFKDVRIFGLHALTDGLLSGLSTDAVSRYFQLEGKTIGKGLPSLCYYQIVTGVK